MTMRSLAPPGASSTGQQHRRRTRAPETGPADIAARLWDYCNVLRDQDGEPIVVGDSLAADPGERFDRILAKPPSAKKCGTTTVGEQGSVVKGDITR